MDVNVLTIDGSHGEGGGQILRTALTLSALTGKAICIDNIRAHRARPGLAAQHLTAVHFVAHVCRARVSADALDSQSLTFVPQARLIAGTYTFDVASARKGGSAGSVPLILQTVLLPLARASEIVPAASIDRTWAYQAHMWGFAANLPRHIVARMGARAQVLLAERGIDAHVERACEKAECPGAALFLGAEFAHGLGGVCALGRRGKPAEQVASEAVEGLLGYLDSGVALDVHLGDQVLIPATLTTGRSCFTVERVTPHLTTNAWVIERFGCAHIVIQQRDDGTALVTVDPHSLSW